MNFSGVTTAPATPDMQRGGGGGIIFLNFSVLLVYFPVKFSVRSTRKKYLGYPTTPLLQGGGGGGGQKKYPTNGGPWNKKPELSNNIIRRVEFGLSAEVRDIDGSF